MTSVVEHSTACVITSTGKEFIESGKAGDLWLGGDDIDHRLMDLVKRKGRRSRGFRRH